MKRKFPRLTAVLCLCALFLSLSSVGTAAEAAAEGGEVVPAVSTEGIVSELTEFLKAAGKTTNWMSNHGHGQTRMCTVSSGTYYSLFTGKDPEADPLPWSLFRTNPDGTTEVLYSDFIPYNPGGPTTVVMADKNEDIWVFSGWRQDGGTPKYVYHAYHYDVDTGLVTDYYSIVDYALDEVRGNGGGAGYSVACIDVERGEIYAVCNAGDAPGFMEWNVFDIETKEWGQPQGVVLDYRYCYDYLLPDGKGGFHCIAQRDVKVQAIMTDVGLNVYDAAKKYHSHWQHNNMLFDEWDYFHIPDARDSKIELQTAVEPAVYDVLNGMYPDSHMADIFRDKDGLIHFLHTTQENLTPGWHTTLVSYDVSSGLTEVQRVNLDFLAGANMAYNARMFQDTTGAFYVVACKEEVYFAHLEIWMADSPTEPLRLVWSEPLPERRTLGIDALQAATNRNNSIMSDLMKLSLFCTETNTWYRFDVDFAALREYVNAVLS